MGHTEKPMYGQAPLGDGMARKASMVLMSRPYQLHVQEAKAMGQEPMSPQQFMQQNQGG